MSTMFGTNSLLFAVLVILGAFVLALSAKEHTENEPKTQAENEGTFDNIQEDRGKRAANIKIGLVSKINFRQRQENENAKTLQQRLQNVTGKALQQGLQNETSKTLRQRQIKVKDFRDCQDVQKQYGKGRTKSGVFTIKPTGWKPIKVYCDMKTDGGGWTVFQHRFDGSIDFSRTWAKYKSGFGNVEKEFWLGNENIHRISVQSKYKWRINLEDFYGNRRYAEFDNFEVSNEKDNYRIKFGSYSGNAGNGRSQLMKNMIFSTKDNNGTCYAKYKGGWWYNTRCIPASNLNGVYGSKQKIKFHSNFWYGKWAKGVNFRAMKSTTMMIKRVVTHQ